MTDTRTTAEIEADLTTIENNLAGDDDADAGGSHDSLELAEQEASAGAKGWVPQDKYKGDPTKWVDAKTFNERGERFNNNLQKEIAQLKAQLDSFEGTKAAFKKFHEETIEKKNVELKEALTELRRQRSAAIRDGDDDAVTALEDRMEIVKAQQDEVKEVAEETPAARVGPNPVDPVLLEWIDDGNQWFNDDPKLRDYAIAIGEQLKQDGETIRGRKFLDKISGMMVEEFPRKFAAKAKPNATAMLAYLEVSRNETYRKRTAS
jgi:hypothetical protein